MSFIVRTKRESVEEREFRNGAKKMGWFTCKLTSPGINGMPDRFCAKQGKYRSFVILVELKQRGKKPAEIQYHRMAELRKYGVRVFWVDNAKDGLEILALYA